MAKLVVLRSLLPVGEDRVGFGYFLEFFFCLLVAGISVGVMLQRQFSVGLFDLIFAGGTINAKQFVVVLLAVQARSSKVRILV